MHYRRRSDKLLKCLEDLGQTLTVPPGVGGLTTALALAQAGFQDISIFEMASNLGFVGAGIQLAPNMARILDRLGVWKQIAAEAVPCRDTSIRGTEALQDGNENAMYIATQLTVD